MRTLIVIPTYNEIDNLETLLRAVLEITSKEVEFLVVDDQSPDGTGKLAETLAQENPRIHVMNRAEKLGLASAYIQGLQWGLDQGFDALVEMDADFSHHPRYLPRMIELLQEKDVVIGSRYVPEGGTANWGLGRRILSRGGSWYSRTILGTKIQDFTGGFNGWRREVLQAIDLKSVRSQGYAFQIELKYRASQKGFKLIEFPIIFEDRRVGQSKMSRRIVFEALLRVWEIRLRSFP
jgi:dolichol-phosphate mannosyltransferase